MTATHIQSRDGVREIESVQHPRAAKEPATPTSQHVTSEAQALSVAAPEESWARHLPCPAPAKRPKNREAIDSEAFPRHRQVSQAEDCESQEVGSAQWPS